MIVTKLFSVLRGHPFFVVTVLATLAALIFEYLSGWFCLIVLKKRLWDYSSTKCNLHGHIDVKHGLYWFVLINLWYFLYNCNLLL